MDRHRWWAIGTFLLLAASAALLYRTVPVRYTASAGVRLDCPAGDGCDAADRGLAERAVLASPRIAGQVFRALGQADREAIAGDGTDRGAALLLARVTVTPGDEPGSVVVRYSDTDPARAVAVAAGFAERYVTFRRETGARVRRIGQWRTAADDARTDMMRARAAAAAYRATAVEDDGERLQREAAALDLRLAGLRAREQAPVDEAGEPGAEASLKTLQARLVQLTAGRARLQERYGPLHPDMIAINGRVAALIERVAAATDRLRDAADAARAAHQRLDEETAATAVRHERQALLDDEAAAAASRHALAAAKLRAATTLSPDRGDARLLASASLVATTPLLGRDVASAIGLLVALTGAGLVVAVREWRAPGVRSRAAAERMLRLPVLGTIPEAPVGTSPAASGAAPDLADAVAAVVAALRRDADRGRPGSIAVTSAFESEGKTTVSIGLARLAARAGLRVLLIDCDVRRPAATRALGGAGGASLADVLAGRIDLAHARRRDEASGAWFLPSAPAGTAGLAGADLVGSEAMRRLIERAGEDHDLVLLDTAPVLALAETRVAAAFVGRVLLVARWRTTPVAAIRLAATLLDEAGAEVGGLILTRVPPSCR